jgi:hypothetical protein
MIRMTWKQFEDKYQFETDENGSDLVEIDSDRVKEIEAKHGDNAWRYIWTWCSEGSDEYFVVGYAFVNRMNYMIATVPHDLEEGESVEIVEDYDELSQRPKNELAISPNQIEGYPQLNTYLHYKNYDLWIDNHLVKVEIFAEQNIDDYVWFSLAKVMETSEYKDWNPEEEGEKGEFDFDKLVKTELMGNRYLGRDIVADTFMKTRKWERHLPNELIEDYITEGDK